MAKTTTGEGYIPYAELTDEQRAMVDGDYEGRLEAAQNRLGLDKLVDDEGRDVRIMVAGKGFGLEKLLEDPDPDVRAAVARQGYGLDTLASDEEWSVRAAVADQGYGLDVLVHDENRWVREAVARQGFALGMLAKDDEPIVRQAVARQGYNLEGLVNDPDPVTRATVARLGYGLDKLISDNHKVRYREPLSPTYDEYGDIEEQRYAEFERYPVVEAVLDYLRENGVLTLNDWVAANPDRCALPENRRTRNSPVPAPAAPRQVPTPSQDAARVAEMEIHKQAHTHDKKIGR